MPPDPIAALTADASGLTVDAFAMGQHKTNFSLHPSHVGLRLRVSVADGESDFGFGLNFSAEDAMSLGRMLYNSGKALHQANESAAGTAAKTARAAGHGAKGR